MSIHGYQDGDEQAIAELFETRAGRREWLDCFEWRHVDAPGAFPTPAVVVARGNDKVIGFAAATRADMILNGRVHRAAQIGTMSLGRPSGEAELDKQMLAALLERLQAEEMSYAFVAAPESERPALREAGFEFVFEVFARSLYIGLEAVSARLSKRALSPFRKFAKEARRIRTKISATPIDQGTIETTARLFATPELPVEIGIVKDAAYLSWRYGKDPRSDYELLAYRKNAGQGMDAFAFVRRQQSETGRKIIHVDEQWTRLGGRRTNAKLFGELAMIGLTEESDVLRCFAPAGTSREQALLGLGCIRKKVERAFMVKRLTPSAPALRLPIAARDIPISAGDLDLYGP